MSIQLQAGWMKTYRKSQASWSHNRNQKMTTILYSNKLILPPFPPLGWQGEGGEGGRGGPNFVVTLASKHITKCTRPLFVWFPTPLRLWTGSSSALPIGIDKITKSFQAFFVVPFTSEIGEFSWKIVCKCHAVFQCFNRGVVMTHKKNIKSVLKWKIKSLGSN